MNIFVIFGDITHQRPWDAEQVGLGQVGCRKSRTQEKKDHGKDKFKTGRIQERRDTGKDGCRTGGMQKNDGCRTRGYMTRGMQERRYEGKEG